jgi:hypothetical protein
MSVTVYTDLNALEVKVEELQTLHEKILHGARAGQGWRQITVPLDMDRSSRTVLLETWERRTNHNGSMQWRLQSGDSATVPTLSTEASRHLYLKSVDA